MGLFYFYNLFIYSGLHSSDPSLFHASGAILSPLLSSDTHLQESQHQQTLLAFDLETKERSSRTVCESDDVWLLHPGPDAGRSYPASNILPQPRMRRETKRPGCQILNFVSFSMKGRSILSILFLLNLLPIHYA